MMNKVMIGIDLGGTNLKGTLLTSEGQVLLWKRIPTEGQMGPEGVTRQIAAFGKALLIEAGIDISQVVGVGLGLPGLVDSEAGVAKYLPNLPGWREIPVVEWLQNEVHLPVVIENDGRMAAYGEKNLGAGCGVNDLVCLTIGTGLGSGIFLGGKLWKGYAGVAGEVGHMTVESQGLECSCGNHGCLEMYVSGRSLTRRTHEALKTYTQPTLLSHVSEGNPRAISARAVGEAAALGDELALKVVGDLAYYLGLGLANLANILNPQRFVVGGGVMGLGDLLLEPAKAVVKKRAMPINREVEITKAQLGERAGAMGAALMVKEAFAK